MVGGVCGGSTTRAARAGEAGGDVGAGMVWKVVVSGIMRKIMNRTVLMRAENEVRDFRVELRKSRENEVRKYAKLGSE
jgi:hypothetical protein